MKMWDLFQMAEPIATVQQSLACFERMYFNCTSHLSCGILHMSEKELSIFYCAWKYTSEHKRKTERRSFWISNFSADSRQVQFGFWIATGKRLPQATSTTTDVWHTPQYIHETVNCWNSTTGTLLWWKKFSTGQSFIFPKWLLIKSIL